MTNSTEVTVEQVVALVQNNEEVRNALTGVIQPEVTPEAFTAFLDTEEGKKAIQPKLDQFASNAINTWKNNNLQKEIDKAVIAANPSETPEQRQIREIQAQLAEQQKKATYSEQKAYALGLAQQMNLPVGMVENFVGETAEQTLIKARNFENEWKSSLQVAIEGMTGRQGRSHLPPSPQASNQQSGAPERKLSEMSLTEQQNLYVTNRREYDRLSTLEG